MHAKRVKESKKSGCTVQCTAVVCSLEDVLDGHLFCMGRLAQQDAGIHTLTIVGAGKVLFSSIRFWSSGSPLLHQPIVQIIFNLNSSFCFAPRVGDPVSSEQEAGWSQERRGRSQSTLRHGVLSRKHWIFSSSATRTPSRASALLFRRAKYLRSRYSVFWRRNAESFMERRVSLSILEDHAIGSCSEPNASNPGPHTLFL